uniref:Uncharacterized protein n=1 Tax=Haemonchus contortus TaxID=6289 RepID=A0A7I4YHX8_HAECO
MGYLGSTVPFWTAVPTYMKTDRWKGRLDDGINGTRTGAGRRTEAVKQNRSGHRQTTTDCRDVGMVTWRHRGRQSRTDRCEEGGRGWMVLLQGGRNGQMREEGGGLGRTSTGGGGGTRRRRTGGDHKEKRHAGVNVYTSNWSFYARLVTYASILPLLALAPILPHPHLSIRVLLPFSVSVCADPPLPSSARPSPPTLSAIVYL